MEWYVILSETPTKGYITYIYIYLYANCSAGSCSNGCFRWWRWQQGKGESIAVDVSTFFSHQTACPGANTPILSNFANVLKKHSSSVQFSFASRNWTGIWKHKCAAWCITAAWEARPQQASGQSAGNGSPWCWWWDLAVRIGKSWVGWNGLKMCEADSV